MNAITQTYIEWVCIISYNSLFDLEDDLRGKDEI